MTADQCCWGLPDLYMPLMHRTLSRGAYRCVQYRGTLRHGAAVYLVSSGYGSGAGDAEPDAGARAVVCPAPYVITAAKLKATNHRKELHCGGLFITNGEHWDVEAREWLCFYMYRAH